ncbi:MAG: choice-of-anchor J domain-containing protein, partial [Sphaerochaeta sp.]|nr:choice-of-anchor J domain-containing protein [Sphaerochaeta sp.]
DLAPGTTYYWQVVPENENGPAAGCPVWSFSTPGADQLAESFELTAFPPAGWANPGTWSRSTSTYNHGVASAYKYPYDSALYIISTPKVTINATSTLSFMSYCSTTNASAVWDVVYSPDRTSWTQVPGSSFTHPTASTWVQRSIDLSSLAGNNYYLGIRAGGYSYASYYFDKVIGPAITPEAPGAPALSAPADLAINVSEFPTLSWTAPTTGGVPTGYNLYMDTVDGSTLYASGVSSPYVVPVVLDYETTYYWTVKAFNNAGTGDAPAARSFTVMSDPTIYTIPYTEGFEEGNTHGSTTVVNWTQASVTGTKSWTVNSTNTTYNRSPRTGSYNVTLAWSASTWMFRPVDLTGGVSYDVIAWARQDNANTDFASLTIAYGTEGSAAGMVNTIVPETGLTNGDYQRLFGSFTPATTGIYYIGILGTLPTSTNWYVSIDDITIRETPEGAPEAVTLNGPTDEAPSVSVMPTFTWTASLNGAPPTGYDLYLDTTDGSTLFAHDVSSPYTLVNALPYSTEHFWTVVAYNGTGDGPAATPFSFTTMPDPTVTSFPWTEGFETVTIPALPNGWSMIDNNADADAWVTSTTYPHTGTKAACIYTDYNEANDDYLVTPQIELTGNQRLKFWTRAHSAGEPDEISVLLSTTTPTVGAFTNVLMASTPVNYVTYTEYEIDLSAYSGSCYIAFARNAAPADGWNLYVDDVRVEDIPTTAIFNLTPDVASWDFGPVPVNNAAIKTFSISNTGAADLTFSSISVNGTYFSANPAFDLSPIPAGQSRDFTVQFLPTVEGGPYAGSFDISFSRETRSIALSGSGYAPASLPLTEDWESGQGDWVIANGTQTNAWFIGTADPYAGANSAYISNDS